MIDARSRRAAPGGRRDALLNGVAATRDSEAQLAATLRPAELVDEAPSDHDNRRRPRPSRGPQAAARRAADQIAESIQARLPGQIRDFQVRVEQDRFVLSGVSSSYYVKQMAQHVAMNALNVLMRGRLINEIQVHSLR
jgi:hypothetical protein